MDIFKETNRPDKALLYTRDDPLDKRLGAFVSTDPGDYEKSDIVLLGCPQDEGVRRNRGRPGAALAPREIRRLLYKFPVPSNLGSDALFDLGNTLITDSLEEVHSRHLSITYQLLKDGKRVIVLGGGNDISFPDCVALSQVSDNMLVLNIDSHYDVREDHPRNSGTPYRQLLEGKFLKPAHFYEIAAKRLVNSPEYERYLHDKGVNIYSLEAVRESGIENLFDSIVDDNKFDSIFWGFDIDSVRANDAPGASAPYPVGLTAEEICRIARMAGKEPRTRIFEITEVNPKYDIDHRTCKLAAMMIVYYLGAMMERKKEIKISG